MCHRMNHLETRLVLGPTGHSGPTGHIGYRGHTGYKGRTGCTGPTGLSGKDGTKGETVNGAGLFNLVSTYSDIKFPTGNSILKTDNNYIASIAMTVEQYRVLVFTFEAPVNSSNTLIGLHRSDDESLFCHSIHFLSQTMNIILNANDVTKKKLMNNLAYTSGDTFSFIVEETRLTITKNGVELYEGLNYYPTDYFKGAFRISTVGQQIKYISFGYLSRGQTGPSGVAQTGSMMYYVGNNDPPYGWLRCNGGTIAAGYSSLIAMLQTTVLPNMPEISDISGDAVVGSYIIKW